MTASRDLKSTPNAISFERIDPGEAEGLEKPFTEGEVFRALSNFRQD